MTRNVLPLLALALAAPLPAAAGSSFAALGSFLPIKELQCYGKTVDSGLLCDPIASGVVMNQYSSTRIRVAHDEAGLLVDVEGADLVAELGVYANGAAGMRVRGNVTRVEGTRHTRGVEELTASVTPPVLESSTDTVADYIQIDIVATGVVIDIVETGFRQRFDRNGLTLAALVDDEEVELMSASSGVARIAGRNGDVLLNKGGTFVDAFGSTLQADAGDYSGALRLVVEGAAELGGTDWDIASSRDADTLEINTLLPFVTDTLEINHPFENLGGAEFRVTLAEASIATAVIAGDVYRLR
ncbi:MAG: hypothetical protein Q8P18_09540 [Pseudomonadota bacterium]|nr:hypothetical protein [Pseudomonadota bacterium]